MKTLTLALWPVNMGAAPGSIADAAARIEARMAEAAEAGAGLLMLTEYVSALWLASAPADLPERAEVEWMARHGDELLERLRPLPARYDVALLAGTWPARTDARWVNRAFLLLTDGRIVTQDKLCLTPTEQQPEAWQLQPGAEIRIVDWLGWRVAMLICLDIEQPALSALLQHADLDLLLVPSMTRQLSGHARVMSCAKARAVELTTTVAVAGCIGTIPGDPPSPLPAVPRSTCHASPRWGMAAWRSSRWGSPRATMRGR